MTVKSLSGFPLSLRGVTRVDCIALEEKKMERDRYSIDDGNASETCSTMDEAIEIVSEWYDWMVYDDPETEGVEVPDFREILSDKCGEREPTVYGLQCSINEWIRQIVDSKPEVFPHGEYGLHLAVRGIDEKR